MFMQSRLELVYEQALQGTENIQVEMGCQKCNSDQLKAQIKLPLISTMDSLGLEQGADGVHLEKLCEQIRR